MRYLISKPVLTLVVVFASGGLSQTMAALWNVTDFGARGDAVQTSASCAINSPQVTLAETNALSGSDVGKLIELFGVGARTSGTNHQDLIATILAVTNGNQVTISTLAGNTATNVNCTYGTQNAGAFQSCVDACQGSNAVMLIPAGRYLLASPQVLDPTFVMASAATLSPAVSLSKGGIQFQGDTPENTVLLGNGAWTLNNGSVQRGVLIGCVGPVTNDAPLTFENLTFDGGVQSGNLHLNFFPASPVNGTGWDITHGAVVDMGQIPIHAYKQFINCHLTHWRGEMLKGVVGYNVGFTAVYHCVFQDGDGSGYNMNCHLISSCLFSNLGIAIEYYVGIGWTNSVFENNVLTNTGGICLSGALTNNPSRNYSIISNVISATKYGITLGPARNVVIAGNTFFGGMCGVATDGYAYQGQDYNQNILVQNNLFMNTCDPIMIGGGGVDRLVNMTCRTNTAWGCQNFAGGYGWSSNVLFFGNASFQPSGVNVNQDGGINSGSMGGQWYFDDVSDNFPLWMDWAYTSPSLTTLTNIVTYARGMHHQLCANTSRAAYLLDTSYPERIPPGAQLVLSNASQFSVSIYPASTNWLGTPLVLPANASSTYDWSNSVWMEVPSSPGNLRAGPH